MTQGSNNVFVTGTYEPIKPEFTVEGLSVGFKNNTLKYLGNIESPQAGEITWTFDVELTRRKSVYVKTRIPTWLRWPGKSATTECITEEEVTTHRVTGFVDAWRYTDSGYKCDKELSAAMLRLMDIILHRISRHGKINKPGMGALAELDSEL